MDEIGAKLASASAHVTALVERIGEAGGDPGQSPAFADGDAAEPLGQREHERQHGLPARAADPASPPQGGGFPAGGTGIMPPRPGDGGTPITVEMRTGLREIESAMADADALAGGNEFLAPGIEHVRTNVRLLGVGKTLPSNALSLTHEIEIELRALGNNALILQAEDHLHAASASVAKGRPEQTRAHLQAASGALDQANQRGAYHVYDDLQTVTVLLKGMSGGPDGQGTVSAPLIEELVADIHEHLADLQGD